MGKRIRWDAVLLGPGSACANLSSGALKQEAPVLHEKTPATHPTENQHMGVRVLRVPAFRFVARETNRKPPFWGSTYSDTNPYGFSRANQGSKPSNA